MSIWKTLFGSGSNPQSSAKLPNEAAVQKSSSKPECVTYVCMDKSDTSTYEIYRANNAETAKEFLLTKRVDENKYYIIVETPEGAWGLDKHGLYLERLLPFQKNPEAAECDISAYIGMPDSVGLEMAANRINESFVVKLRCGSCQHEWLDAVRYQTAKARSLDHSQPVLCSII